MDDPPVGSSLVGRPDVTNVLLLSTVFDREGPLACPSYIEPPADDTPLVVGVAVISTPDEWLSDVVGSLDDRPERVCVVAVGEEVRSVADSGEQAPTPLTDVCVKQVAAPGNLTAMGVRITECIESMEGTTGQLTLCFEDLTVLLQHADVRTVFKFLNVLTSLVAANDGFAHYHLDPTAVGRLDVAKLRSLFDAVVDRNDDGDVTVRAR